MANNLITEENLDKIKFVLPNIILMDLQGRLEVSEIVEPKYVEEVKEDVISAEPSLEDLIASVDAAKLTLEYLSKKDKKSTQEYIDALEIQIDIMKMS
jgi:hypothetical protein